MVADDESNAVIVAKSVSSPEFFRRCPTLISSQGTSPEVATILVTTLLPKV